MRRQQLYMCVISFFISGSIGYGGESRDAESFQDLNSQLNQIARSYVKLVLAVGQHDSMYVDAYYGPREWLEEAQSSKKPLDGIKQAALSLAAELDSLDSNLEEEILQLRWKARR